MPWLAVSEQPTIAVENEQLTSDQLIHVDAAVHAAVEDGDCCELVPPVNHEGANAVVPLIWVLLESK
jgi:hypothetical protein